MASAHRCRRCVRGGRLTLVMLLSCRRLLLLRIDTRMASCHVCNVFGRLLAVEGMRRRWHGCCFVGTVHLLSKLTNLASVQRMSDTGRPAPACRWRHELRHILKHVLRMVMVQLVVIVVVATARKREQLAVVLTRKGRVGCLARRMQHLVLGCANCKASNRGQGVCHTHGRLLRRKGDAIRRRRIVVAMATTADAFVLKRYRRSVRQVGCR